MQSGTGGQRITLTAQQATANASNDERLAEVVQVAMFAPFAVALKAEGATPSWNSVVADTASRRPPRQRRSPTSS